MEELKPVAWQFKDSDGEWRNGSEHHNHYQNTVDGGYEVRHLYAIPDGCVVVPVDEIKKAVEAGFMASGQGYNGEHCGSFDPEVEALEVANKYIEAMKDATFPRGSVVDEEV